MPNPNSDNVIMTALSVIMPIGTNLTTSSNAVYIEDMASLSRGAFPALHLEAGKQSFARVSTNTWDGTVQVKANYYDRWDDQFMTIDAVRQAIKADVRIMVANVQENESLVVASVAHATSIARIDLSPYGTVLDNKTVPGQSLVYQSMTIFVNILPYDQ